MCMCVCGVCVCVCEWGDVVGVWGGGVRVCWVCVGGVWWWDLDVYGMDHKKVPSMRL